MYARSRPRFPTMVVQLTPSMPNAQTPNPTHGEGCMGKVAKNFERRQTLECTDTGGGGGGGIGGTINSNGRRGSGPDPPNFGHKMVTMFGHKKCDPQPAVLCNPLPVQVLGRGGGWWKWDTQHI